MVSKVSLGRVQFLKTDLAKRQGLGLSGALSVIGMTAVLAVGGVVVAPAASAAEPLGEATLVEVDRPGTTMISSAPFDVGEYGYEELEYFVSGEAHQYLDDGEVFGHRRETTYPAVQGPIAGDYTTRVVVRKPPVDRFNGTLVVEWTNVTAGQDGEFLFAEAYETLLRDGYAVAVVSVQSIGVENLKTTRPERYGDLEVDPDCGDVVCPVDTMSWDILAQSAKALKESPDSPFADLDIEKVLATGQSQSSSLLATYYSKIQRIHQFFDGFVIYDGSGIVSNDVETPLIAIKNEHSVTPPTFRPVTGDYTRVWQAAGASHSSKFVADYMNIVFRRDGTQPEGRSFTEWSLARGFGQCANSNTGTKVRVGQIIGGALASVDTWSRGGQPAAPSTYFDITQSGSYLYGDRGLIEGGLKIADSAVPIYKFGVNTGRNGMCAVAGWHGDYSLQELEQMYVSHAAYVAEVTAVTEAALASGYIVAGDAAQTIAEAEASGIAETDISLSSTANPSGNVGEQIALTVVPKLTRGAWLEVDGAKVPIAVTGKAFFVAEQSAAAAAVADVQGELVWEERIEISDLSPVPTELTLPDAPGTVTVQWCIDGALQNGQFTGHVNETCASDDLSMLSIAVNAETVTPTDPTDPADPADPAGPAGPAGSVGPQAGGVGGSGLAATGGASPAMAGFVALGVIVAGAATYLLSRRSRKASEG